MGVGRARVSGHPHFWRDGLIVSWWNSCVISACCFPGDVAVQGPSTILTCSWVGACKKTEESGVGGSNYHEVQVLLTTVMVKSHFYMQIFIALGCVPFVVDFLLDLLHRARCCQLPPASLDASVQVRIITFSNTDILWLMRNGSDTPE